MLATPSQRMNCRHVIRLMTEKKVEEFPRERLVI